MLQLSKVFGQCLGHPIAPYTLLFHRHACLWNPYESSSKCSRKSSHQEVLLNLQHHHLLWIGSCCRLGGFGNAAEMITQLIHSMALDLGRASQARNKEIPSLIYSCSSSSKLAALPSACFPTFAACPHRECSVVAFMR